MYINPFVAGMLAVIIVELMIVIAGVVIVTVKEMKRGKRRNAKADNRNQRS